MRLKSNIVYWHKLHGIRLKGNYIDLVVYFGWMDPFLVIQQSTDNTLLPSDRNDYVKLCMVRKLRK